MYAAFNGAYGDIKSRSYFVVFIAVGVEQKDTAVLYGKALYGEDYFMGVDVAVKVCCIEGYFIGKGYEARGALTFVEKQIVHDSSYPTFEVDVHCIAVGIAKDSYRRFLQQFGGKGGVAC